MKRILLLILLCCPVAAQADGPLVAVSIKPIHSLVSSLMQGVAEPVLIVSAAGSPHAYNLRPSEARALNRADLIVWVGPELESFMEKPLAAIKPPARQLSLLHDLADLQRYPARQGGEWHDVAVHGHDHDALLDPHIWLSPTNARIIASAVTRHLQAIDPKNSEQYGHNRDLLIARLDALDQQLTVRLKPLQQYKYLVFHDAYQYFEKHFGLQPAGALAIDPQRRPGARRLAELKQVIRERRVECIFAEPQFEPRLIDVLTENSSLTTGILDPLGADLKSGPDLYFTLLEKMATSLESCLTPGH